MRRNFLVALVIAVFTFAVSQSAFACLCTHSLGKDATEAEYRQYAVQEYNRAEIVLIGTIRAVEPENKRCTNPDWDFGYDYNPSEKAVIEISSVLKGRIPNEVTIKTGGAVSFDDACRATSSQSSCDIYWKDGDYDIWVLRSLPDGTYELADKCLTWVIRAFISKDSGMTTKNDN